MTGFLDVWLIDLERDAEQLSARTDLIGALELGRSERLTRPTDRIAYLASHAGLRIVLQAYGSASGELSRDERGKPYLLGGPEFSLSRANGVAAIAVSDQPVGIDIEIVRPVALTEPAIAWMARMRGTTRLQAWTALEAWAKWNGCGMAQLLGSLGLSEIWRSNWLSLADPQLRTLAIPDRSDYCATVCSDTQSPFHTIKTMCTSLAA